MHRTSQHERSVDEVVSSDFVPFQISVPGLYAKVNRAYDVHYIHEADIIHVRAFLGRYVEKLFSVSNSQATEESSYWIMPYSSLQLADLLPDWVKDDKRLVVNHLRHYHSNYEQALRSMRSAGTYSRGKYLNAFTWFNCEIGKYYPDLMTECQRQIDEKLEFEI